MPAILSYDLISVTGKNLDFWSNYACAMRMIANSLSVSPEMKNGWENAVKGFLDALDCFRNKRDDQAWIAVATFGPVTPNDFVQTAVNIEMCMTVTTHPQMPVTTHMGIFRSPLRSLEQKDRKALKAAEAYRVPEIVALLEQDNRELRAPRGLSANFHSFAAKRCTEICGGKRKLYMVTAPLKKMMEMMLREFGESATDAVKHETGPEGDVLVIGKGTEQERCVLGQDALRACKWLEVLAHVRGDEAKVAIAMDSLVNKFEASRVEVVLDWLDRWTRDNGS